MANEIRVGSEVYLKSGGPPMTVNGMANNNAQCSWFDRNHTLQHGAFSPEALRLATPEDRATGKVAGDYDPFAAG